jgi:G6PDH family F420-dependent oxidoreductase
VGRRLRERRRPPLSGRFGQTLGLPEQPLKLGIAASGEESGRLAGRKADCLIAVETSPAVVAAFDGAGGEGNPRVGQLPISYDPDRDAAVKRALELFGWFGGGWKVNAELPGPAAFEAASAFVRPEDIAEAIPCGDSLDAVVGAVQEYADAGFTHVALCQIGGDHQAGFLEWWQRHVGPALGAGEGGK